MSGRILAIIWTYLEAAIEIANRLSEARFSVYRDQNWEMQREQLRDYLDNGADAIVGLMNSSLDELAGAEEQNIETHLVRSKDAAADLKRNEDVPLDPVIHTVIADLISGLQGKLLSGLRGMVTMYAVNGSPDEKNVYAKADRLRGKMGAAPGVIPPPFKFEEKNDNIAE